jgi:DNA-binding transcriptional regulator YiaG
MKTMTNKKCPICNQRATPEYGDYKSKKRDKITNEFIVVKDVPTFNCTNQDCLHSWLPSDEERRIDREVYERSRFDLTPDEVRLIRECLPFSTKRKAADFLCLNEKAFTKWERDYCNPNRANDLLLRLCAYSEDNLNFIKHLHKTSFRFVKEEYELICNKFEIEWKQDMLAHSILAINSINRPDNNGYKNIDEEYSSYEEVPISGQGDAA